MDYIHSTFIVYICYATIISSCIWSVPLVYSRCLRHPWDELWRKSYFIVQTETGLAYKLSNTRVHTCNTFRQLHWYFWYINTLLFASLKGVLAKNKRFWSLQILLLSVASIRIKLLKIPKVAIFDSDRKRKTNLKTNHSDITTWVEYCNFLNLYGCYVLRYESFLTIFSL